VIVLDSFGKDFIWQRICKSINEFIKYDRISISVEMRKKDIMVQGPYINLKDIHYHARLVGRINI
jgi:hypothetical protein